MPANALRWLLARLYMLMLVDRRAKMPTGDRRFLEQVLFREIILQHSSAKVLFVGVHKFSDWYARIFELFSRVDFWTVDPHQDPPARAAGDRHIRESLLCLAERPEMHSSFDFVFINGVFGYGIDADEDKMRALHTSHLLLKENGLLIVGYRDLPVNADFSADLAARARFTPKPFSNRVPEKFLAGGSNRHTFLFLGKEGL